MQTGEAKTEPTITRMMKMFYQQTLQSISCKFQYSLSKDNSYSKRLLLVKIVGRIATINQV